MRICENQPIRLLLLLAEQCGDITVYTGRFGANMSASLMTLLTTSRQTNRLGAQGRAGQGRAGQGRAGQGRAFFWLLYILKAIQWVTHRL